MATLTMRCSLAAVLLLTVAVPLHAADAALPRVLEYPKDLRSFRARALKADGAFAPDIAFALRTCPKCGKPYVFGTFPRLKRRPFDNLAAVHQVVAAACLRKAPSSTMYSARQEQMVLRACPACGEPENAGLADKVLFCHMLPEDGTDMQIEYEAKDGKLLSHKFWRVPKGGEAAEVVLPDESEDAIKQAYGQHFSLRAVWNELFTRDSREDLFSVEAPKVVYRQVAPGMWFVFRPRSVSSARFKEFSETQLKSDRDKGIFDRLDTPLRTDASLDDDAGDYRIWAAPHEAALSTGNMECFAAFSCDELRKAARDILATRGVVLETVAGTQKPDAGKGVICKGEFKTDVNLGGLGARAVHAGLSLHHACAFYLTAPMFTVENAEGLSRVLRARYARCTAEVVEGRYLVLTDAKKEERKVDLLNLADKLDLDDPGMFDLFCSIILAWNPAAGCFDAKPNDRDVAPTGLPAFIERRVRPVGHLKARNLADALFEPREDRDGKPFDLCYTSECTTGIVYVDPAKDRFKGLTLQDAQRLYDVAGGTLPMHVEAQDSLSFPDDRTAVPPVLFCKACLLCGLDLASLGTDRARAAALAVYAQMGLHIDDRLHFYALTTNCVVLAPRKLGADELKLVRSRATGLLNEASLEPGLELDLHFDLPMVEPKGKVVRRHR